MNLDLYAKAEHLLGIEAATEILHERYVEALTAYGVGSVLDIGCGRGGLMERLQEENISVRGIDLSQVMVDEAIARGLDAEQKNLCECDGRFDAAVAVFDVLNFMDKESLETFLGCVADILKPDGLFIADINTLHGFSDVADGTMNAEDETHFLSVDAVFSDNELRTVFTLFTQKSGNIFEKEQELIVQYFHPLRFFRKVPALKLIRNENISLYDTNDKTLLIFKKR